MLPLHFQSCETGEATEINGSCLQRSLAFKKDLKFSKKRLVYFVLKRVLDFFRHGSR